jgi:hypothetical protein
MEGSKATAISPLLVLVAVLAASNVWAQTADPSRTDPSLTDGATTDLLFLLNVKPVWTLQRTIRRMGIPALSIARAFHGAGGSKATSVRLSGKVPNLKTGDI